MGIMAIRVVAAFIEPLSHEAQVQDSLWHTLPLAGLLCLYVALSLGMFWMIMHKLSLQAQRQAENRFADQHCQTGGRWMVILLSCIHSSKGQSQ